MKPIFYNLLALFSAGLNLLNSFLAWHLFGASSAADIWLLSIATIAAFNVLALLGVEQFLYCYVDERTRGQQQADDFAKTVLLWSLLSGLVFSIGCALLMPFIVRMFAGGLEAQAQARLAVLMLSMLPQTAAAPCLHVVRQLLNAHGQYARAYLLVMWAPAVLLVAQLAGMLLGWPLENLAWVVGAGALLQVGLCLQLARQWWRSGRRLANPVLALRGFILKSVSMRSAHALHNFLSVAIIGSVLSTLSAGSLSIFLYAKRIAEGVSSISVGPHVNIYHAKLAQSWSEFNRGASLQAARSYLKHVLPLFLLGVGLAWFLLPQVLLMTSSLASPASIDSMMLSFLLISVWNLIIIIESVFVAVLTTAHRAVIFGLVNGLFIVSFYTLTSLHLGISAAIQLPIGASIAQCVSLALFASVAYRLFNRHFEERP